jgi:phospholipid/cholesterol/gamma-HCH transport system permease protein
MEQAQATFRFEEQGDIATLVLDGDCVMGVGLPSLSLPESIVKGRSRVVRYDASALGQWDSVLVSALHSLERRVGEAGVSIDRDALPAKLRGLLEMAMSVPVADVGRAAPHGRDPFWKVGVHATQVYGEFLAFIDFAGQCTIAFAGLVCGRSRMRWKDFWAILQDVGPNALPIVALISFLVGIIIAFLGAVVLARFGAEFAIAYLVGYGMLREMGAIMTGVIMSGRTGAAFAAQLGSMKVNEEIDALKTLGIPPVEFLVLPRMVTMILMMPVLTIFADLIGIFGGYLVAVGMMGVPSGQFFSRMDFVVSANDVCLGLVKSMVFGAIVATSGCLRGMQCKSGADSVGVAATRAVVLAITLIIFANAVIDWVAAQMNV